MVAGIRHQHGGGEAMRRHRNAGVPVQPHWETRETTQETAFAWICWGAFILGRRA